MASDDASRGERAIGGSRRTRRGRDADAGGGRGRVSTSARPEIPREGWSTVDARGAPFAPSRVATSPDTPTAVARSAIHAHHTRRRREIAIAACSAPDARRGHRTVRRDTCQCVFYLRDCQFYLRPGRAGSRRAATWNLKIPESVEFGPSRKLVTRSPRSFFPPPPPPFSRRPRELDASGGAPVRTRARRLCTNGLTNILLALFRSRRSLSPRRFGSADSGPSRSSRSSFYALAAPSSAIILALLRSSASLLSAAYSLLACSSAVGPISCGAVAASLA